MATKRQNAANRRNASRSTGPRTKEGRQVSSLNSLKHGLRSQFTVIPGENEADFHALFDAFAEEAAPESARDIAAVRKATVCEWRLRRIAAIETEMFVQALKQPAEEATIDNIEAIVERLAVQQSAPPQSPLVTLAQRFLSGEIKHFGALARYEASLNRQYNQAWQELDSRPEPVEDFRGVFDPADEADSQPEPHYTEPTPDALVWKSATGRYAEAKHIKPDSPPDSEPAAQANSPLTPVPGADATTVNTATSEQHPETAQTNPIPESDTPDAPRRQPSLVPFPRPVSTPIMIEWVRGSADINKGTEKNSENPLDEEEMLKPGA
jgi:hypothetical protein